MKNKIFYFVVAAFLIILPVIAIDVVFPVKYADEIKKYCDEYDVERSTVFSVIWTESKFRPAAVSGAGARGLMQLMPSTAKWLSEEIGCEYDEDKLFEPDYNIRLGVYYISYLQKKFSGDYVFAAYNAGEGNVEKWLGYDGKIAFSETRDYIKKVNAVKKIYKLRV